MSKQIIIIFILFMGMVQAYSQIDSFNVGFDLRTRPELDHGQGKPIAEGRAADAIIRTRARLNLDYYYKNLQIYVSIQDVRVWGEHATAAAKNQNFILNEAWAKYQFTPAVALKIGRQRLSYDDERLIGALDWAMQGRSFDGAKGIVHLGQRSKLEAVVTYNNDDNTANDIPAYQIYGVTDAGENAKSLQILHYQYKNPNPKAFQFSAIALNSVVQHKTTGVHYDMLTLGVNAKKYTPHFGVFGSAYYQLGNNSLGQNKAAYQFSVNADVILNQHVNAVVGLEWLSGKDDKTAASENRSFSPFYGTNHKFNGYMDYFFVGNYFNSYGLNDYYLKTTAKFGAKSTLAANVHAFTSNGTIADNLSSYLGTEVDLVFTYKVSPSFVVIAGQSLMFAGEAMKTAREVPKPQATQLWSWLGFYFTPRFRLK